MLIILNHKLLQQKCIIHNSSDSDIGEIENEKMNKDFFKVKNKKGTEKIITGGTLTRGSSPRICSLGIQPSAFMRSNQCPITS